MGRIAWSSHSDHAEMPAGVVAKRKEIVDTNWTTFMAGWDAFATPNISRK
jgi:hypothetical protein